MDNYADFHYWLTVLVLVAPPMFLARWIPTRDEQEVARCVREEVDARYNRKESADRMGLPLSDWSEQLNCQQPLNFYRLVRFRGTAFWDAFMRRIARLDGGEYIDAQTVALLNGAARLSQNRPVVSMLLPEAERSEVA